MSVAPLPAMAGLDISTYRREQPNSDVEEVIFSPDKKGMAVKPIPPPVHYPVVPPEGKLQPAQELKEFDQVKELLLRAGVDEGVVSLQVAAMQKEVEAKKEKKEQERKPIEQLVEEEVEKRMNRVEEKVREMAQNFEKELATLRNEVELLKKEKEKEKDELEIKELFPEGTPAATPAVTDVRNRRILSPRPEPDAQSATVVPPTTSPVRNILATVNSLAQPRRELPPPAHAPCRWCGKVAPPEHQSWRCASRPIFCRGCNKEVTAKEYLEHINTCKNAEQPPEVTLF